MPEPVKCWSSYAGAQQRHWHGKIFHATISPLTASLLALAFLAVTFSAVSPAARGSDALATGRHAAGNHARFTATKPADAAEAADRRPASQRQEADSHRRLFPDGARIPSRRRPGALLQPGTVRVGGNPGEPGGLGRHAKSRSGARDTTKAAGRANRENGKCRSALPISTWIRVSRCARTSFFRTASDSMPSTERKLPLCSRRKPRSAWRKDEHLNES